MYIKITDVNKTIKKAPILRDINLEFTGGKVYGLRGKNGSGKTMLMRAICGLITPDSGIIDINGKILGKEYWQRNVLQLSGGQQQRVAIARALASDAHVLLADEPTGNLDETTADEIIALLKKTAHELGKCVVVVTHSKHLAEEADEILEIKNGAISFLSD